jgi:beta-1,4-glucosyltransferase
MSESIQIGNYRVIDTSRRPFARLLRRRLIAKAKTTVFFANANFIVRCDALAEPANRPGTYVVNDGIAVAIAVRARHGRWLRDNLNGTDFTPFLLGQVPSGTRLAMAGSRLDVANRAAAVFAEMPNIDVVDVRDGFEDIRAPDVVEKINAAKPDILLVAMGNPLQEEWILRHRESIHAPLVLGVGALFEFTAGAVVRAPEIVRRAKMEWAFRLCQEPRRLLRRYTVDMAKFFFVVFAPARIARPSR